jgi:3-phytase
MACLFPLALSAQVPTLDAIAETAPIPSGFSDSDDAAVWRHPVFPEQSLILGTSKYDEAGQAGLGVYALDGRELQFFAGSKLNSVDILQDLAVATNRSDYALDLYRIEDGRVNFLKRTPLLDHNGQAFEPYGLCLVQSADYDVHIFLPTKSGRLYEYTLNSENLLELQSTYDLAALVQPEQDAWIKSLVTKETIAEGEEDELEENLAERYILEGCVHDVRTNRLYVGMENLGIWSLDLKEKKAQAELVIAVQGSWTDIEEWQQSGLPRVTDDIEGMDILEWDGRSYLLFSSQGISEFTLYDLTAMEWLGNFQIRMDAADPVSFTDGLAVKTGNLGALYPEGILVVHDDENTDAEGNALPANYKLVSLNALWTIFGKLGD